MRKVLRSVVVGVTFSVGGFGWTGLPGEPPAAYAQEAIPWMNNLDQARQVAQQSQRLVLVHFWNDNCAPCVGVERNVFSRPEVARGIAASYVPVKIKVDDQPELARRLRVDRWPLDVIITPDGQELFRTVSPQDPVRYLTVTDRVAATARQSIAAAAAPANPMNGAPNAAGAIGSPNMPVNPNFAPTSYGAQTGPITSSPPVNTGAFQPTSQPNGGFGPTTGYVPPSPNGYVPPSGSPALSGAAGPVGSPYPGYAPVGGVASGAVPAAGPYGAASVPNQAVPPQFAMANGSGGAPPTSFVSAAQPAYAPAQTVPNMSASANPVAPQAGSVAATSNPPLGLDGFCPVTLYDKKKWKRADSRWGVVHRDRTYLFAGPDEQKKFLANPDKFSPMLSGFDPVHYLDGGKLVTGRREHGVWYQDQMFLFADEASLQQFWTAPSRYIPRVEQAMRSTATSGLTQR